MFHFLCGFASAQPADALFHASTFDGIHPNCLDYFPWGEALNPGPQETLGDTVSFSFSNPSGLRNKEGHVVDLGPGVHAFSETQLSHVTQGSCARQLRSLARQQSRGVRVHFGAPAPLRIRSDWAGSWTGVATISDYPGKQTLTSTGDIHHELLSYWKSTWCALSKVDDMVWARIVGFFQAFVPRFVINVPPLTVAMWRRGLKRFKKTAARGVDGISPADLLALPDHWTELLLKLLHRVEAGIDEWPRAILFGIVNLLAKDDDACTIPRFRPVVVFSVIYRAWSSIRSRQLLRQLQVVIDSDAYGFVPGCEPSQLWLVLQAEIECCLQQTEDKCGLSVDLIRAFNHIPRQHSFALAQHLGVPFTVLTPWKAFLGGCTRAFKIHDVLSESTISTCGMPEGDALSVYAMVQLNLVWHIYQKQFCPSVRACSFVDNLSLTAARPADLAQGYSCLCSFFELWNLQIDLEKSYCWSLSTADRSSLRRFPMKMVYAAPELGGSLSFCRKKHHGLQLLRSQRFSSRWLRLERSMAPLNCKLRALSTVFWPAILHGAN